MGGRPNGSPRLLSTKPYNNYALLVPAAVYMLLIFTVSSIPDTGHAPAIILYTPKILRNLAHIPLYAGLTILLVGLIRGWGVSHRKSVVIATVIAMLYGVADEWHQSFVPGRFASLTDVLLNGVGVGLVAWWFRS